MAVYIEVQTDSFASNLSKEKSQKRYRKRGPRRPYRGIEIKDDTYGVLKVIRSDGQEIPLTDAGGEIPAQVGQPKEAAVDPFTGESTGPASKEPHISRLASTYNYSNFIIQGVVEAREEKAQIMETFGDSYVFFFGEKPRFLQVQGLLMNTLDFNWRTEFWYNYEKVLRGTKLVEQNARVYLYWDDLVVEGYMMNAQAQDNADLPYHIPFSFSLFVTNHTYLGNYGVDDYPIRNAVNIEPLRSSDVENVRKELKKSAYQAAKYTSTVDRVRQANINTVRRNKIMQTLNIQGMLEEGSDFESWFEGGPKNLLLDTVRQGVKDAGFGFINNIVNRFVGKPLVFPRGLAGGESYVGPAQYANMAYPFPFDMKRNIPLRTKIRRNIDEYVGGGDYGLAQGYDDTVAKAEQAAKSRNCFDMELKCFMTLAALGLNPVTEPYDMAGPFSCVITHALDVVTEGVTAVVSNATDAFTEGLSDIYELFGGPAVEDWSVSAFNKTKAFGGRIAAKVPVP